MIKDNRIAMTNPAAFDFTELATRIYSEKRGLHKSDFFLPALYGGEPSNEASNALWPGVGSVVYKGRLVDSKGRPMKRREMLQTLRSASVLGLFPNVLSTQTWAQDVRPFTVRGSGPALIVFDRQPRGYYDLLTDRYRVVVIDAAFITDNSPAGIASLTADRVCADILAVADAAGVDRFAWYGFSFGSVVGLQLASRTSRLSALVCGGWPPLGGQYAETLAFTEEEAAQGRTTPALTFYRSIRSWPEREALSRLTCPRMTFAGSKDEFVAGKSQRMRIGPLIAAHRAELERMGWTVQLIDGFGHELGGRPDVIMPILKRFLDPILLR